MMENKNGRAEYVFHYGKKENPAIEVRAYVHGGFNKWRSNDKDIEALWNTIYGERFWLEYRGGLGSQGRGELMIAEILRDVGSRWQCYIIPEADPVDPVHTQY